MPTNSNTPISLTIQQLSQLQAFRDGGNFSGAYQLLRDAAVDANDLRTVWFDAAVHINANDGTFWADFVRGSTLGMGQLVGHPITEAQFQLASNELALRIINRVLDDGAIPGMTQIIEADVSTVVQDLGLPPYAWAGTLGAPFLLAENTWASNFTGANRDEMNLEVSRVLAANYAGLYQALGFDKLMQALRDAAANLPQPFSLDDLTELFKKLGGAGLSQSIDEWSNAFESAEGATPPPLSCPLVLDLDGDGTESVSVTAGAYFDHSVDGFAEATGWAGADDGLLVWDRDADGRIGSGRELFGTETLLQNGQFAANGFTALAEWDTNADGKIDASDAVWGNLRVWVDADGDGFSAADELLTLSGAGVASINLGYTSGSGVDAAGNEVWLTGSFTRIDASIGQVTDYRFARDMALTIPEEWLELPGAIATQPDVTGFGKVYDLRQAMVRDVSGALQALVEDFVAETGRAGRNSLLEQIVLKWTGADGVDPVSRGANIDARHLVALEAFMGRGFIGVGGSSNPNVAAASLLNNGYATLSESVYAQLMAQSHLESLYDQISYSWSETSQTLEGDLAAVRAVLEDNISHGDGNGLREAAEFMRTVKGFGAGDVLGLDLMLGNPTFALLANFAYVDQLGTTGNETLNGSVVADLIVSLAGTDSVFGMDGNDIIHAGDGNDVIDGGIGTDVLYGGNGNDTLDGGAGADTLNGGAGDDVLGGVYNGSDWASFGNFYQGGAGNDVLRGTANGDTYQFNVGDGQDLIQENSSPTTTDRVVLGAGIAPSDVRVSHAGNDLVLDIGTNGDRVTVQGFYGSTWNRIERLEFSNGTVWDSNALGAAGLEVHGTSGPDTLSGLSSAEWPNKLYGEGGNDTLIGSSTVDQLYGGDGNDTLDGAGGADTLDGGMGDDVLGGAYGSADYSGVANTSYRGGSGNDVLRGTYMGDTYLFALGDGQDVIQEYAPPTYIDRIVLGAGIALSDIQASIAGNDLVLDIGTNGDRITVQGYNSSTWNKVERIDLVDGTQLPLSNLIVGDAAANTLTGTSATDSVSGNGGNDVIYGGAGNDAVRGGAGSDSISGEDGADALFGDSGSDTMGGGAGDDYLAGGTENDIADGGTGNDVVQGQDGDDLVQGSNGNDLLTGDAGSDTLDGGEGNDLLSGGAGNDTIYTGGGSNIIAYNAGGGIDTVYASAGATNTLSFGGGIGYDDLSLSRDGNDLVVSAGQDDHVVLKDWYASASNVLNLQIILDATQEFDANSSDPLYNRKVQTFDFLGVVSEFDAAIAQSPGLTSWAVTNALLQFHLSGADDAALGGDLAYWYGKNGAFSGIGLQSAQQVLGASNFGAEAQSLRPFSGLQEGLVKLS